MENTITKQPFRPKHHSDMLFSTTYPVFINISNSPDDIMTAILTDDTQAGYQSISYHNIHHLVVRREEGKQSVQEDFLYF